MACEMAIQRKRDGLVMGREEKSVEEFVVVSLNSRRVQPLELFPTTGAVLVVPPLHVFLTTGKNAFIIRIEGVLCILFEDA